jgi:hypothetical protein
VSGSGTQDDPFIIDPSARLDYELDWTAWLDGDTIILSDWTGIGLTPDATSFTDKTATVWVQNGALGKASVTNHITTLGGRQNDYTLKFKVQAT